MDGRLCDRLEAAPVLPARAKADTLLARELIERLHDEASAEALRGLFSEHPRSAALVAGVLAHAPFLAQVMRFDPEGLFACLTSAPETRRDALLSDVMAQGAAATDTAELMRVLRRFRQAMALLIALADTGGVWDVETVTAALTATADMAVALASDHVLRQAADLGRITLADPAAPGAGSGLVVLALGKHGAGELNYSSDIDIVVFFRRASSSS
jgi:glutamate-ammonia-ligase adenylyltransferase